MATKIVTKSLAIWSDILPFLGMEGEGGALATRIANAIHDYFVEKDYSPLYAIQPSARITLTTEEIALVDEAMARLDQSRVVLDGS